MPRLTKCLFCHIKHLIHPRKLYICQCFYLHVPVYIYIYLWFQGSLSRFLLPSVISQILTPPLHISVSHFLFFIFQTPSLSSLLYQISSPSSLYNRHPVPPSSLHIHHLCSPPPPPHCPPALWYLCSPAMYNVSDLPTPPPPPPLECINEFVMADMIVMVF